MKLKILKNESLTGKIEISLFVDGKLRMMNRDTSRELTGTVSHNAVGVFEEYETGHRSPRYNYGYFTKLFFFGALWKGMNAKEYAEEIVERIRAIRSWVKECKKVSNNNEYEVELNEK